MTCIVAVAHDGKVTMGGDSAAVDTNYDLGLCAESKVWKQGPVLFGASGTFRVAQVVRWRMQLPTPDPEIDPLNYIVGPLIDAVRTSLSEAGALTTWDETSTEELGDAGLLLGYQGRVFEVFTDFGVGELVNGYGTIGCAASIALGALAATEGMKPRQRVQAALEAAERHSAGVRGPFTIIKG